MLENRSFDHMLGALSSELPDLEGVNAAAPRSNLGPDKVEYQQAPGAAYTIPRDPMHEKPNVLNQLDESNGRFVKDFARSYPDAKPAEWQQVMKYHAVGQLPSLHALARAFAVCDRWFCSVPGPTWTNRLFAMSGTAQGRVEMPAGLFDPNLHEYDQPSLFRRVEEAGLRCRIHFGDFPLSLLLSDRRTLRGARSYALTQSFEDAAQESESDFPDLVWIEPRYLGANANDDHPPHDVRRGQDLIASTYEAIRSNDALWRSTLLVVLYDEHGGFYDHVPPGPAVPPDDHREEYSFDRLGVRVPAVLVSPWLAAQRIHQVVDHTSLLRSLQLRWKLGDLGKRVKAAPDVLAQLELLARPRSDVPKLKVTPASKALLPPGPPHRLLANEQAIVAFSAWLETQTRRPAHARVAANSRALQGPHESRGEAVERAQRFLAQQRAAPSKARPKRKTTPRKRRAPR
jgi:phospholipase C